jgi:hypothetical protein
MARSHLARDRPYHGIVEDAHTMVGVNARQSRGPNLPDEAILAGARMRLLARRPEGENRDLGPAADPEPGVAPEAAVGVQEHPAHLVQPAQIPARKPRGSDGSHHGQEHLPTVGVAGELEVEATRLGTRVRDVGLVGEQDSGTPFRELLQHPIEADHAFEGAVHAAEVQRRVGPAQALDGVTKVYHPAAGEDLPDHGGVRLVVVVAEDGHHPVRGAEAPQWGNEAGYVPDHRTEERRVGREVARDHHEIRCLGVDEFYEPQEASRCHPTVRVEVAYLNNAVPVEPRGEPGQIERDGNNLYVIRLDLASVVKRSHAQKDAEHRSGDRFRGRSPPRNPSSESASAVAAHVSHSSAPRPGIPGGSL